MRLSCFGYVSQIPQIKAAGYESAELNTVEIMRMSDIEYEDFRKRALDSGLGFEVFSELIPLTERIYLDSFDVKYWIDYVKRVGQRIKPLGAIIMPFGAGKCRSIPDRCEDISFVKNKIINFVRGVSEAFKEYDIKLVIEPLGPAFSNYINTIGEAVEFIKLVDDDNCKVMCDLRHMISNGEDMDEIINYKDYILHAHIDYPLGSHRYFPSIEDCFDYKPYINALKQANYKGILTVEATDFNDFTSESYECAKYLNSFLYTEM